MVSQLGKENHVSELTKVVCPKFWDISISIWKGFIYQFYTFTYFNVFGFMEGLKICPPLIKRMVKGRNFEFWGFEFEFDALKGFLQVHRKAIQIPNLTGHHFNTGLAYSPIHCSIVFPLPCCFNRGFPQKSLAIKKFSLLPPNGVTHFLIVRDKAKKVVNFDMSPIWPGMYWKPFESVIIFVTRKRFQLLITKW